MEQNLDFQQIDFSKIKVIPSDTEIPIHNNCYQTKRSLCANSTSNAHILPNLEALFNPIDATECTPDLFGEEDPDPIKDIQALKKYLSELLIRFDTSPKNYTKEDYQYLLYILKGVLFYLYENYHDAIDPDIRVNSSRISKENNIYGINITSGDEHTTITDKESGIEIKTNVGEMGTPSTKLATVNDIRNYIEKRLEWQTR